MHVRRLRAKLGPDHEALIGTVRNVGYRLVPDRAEAQPGRRLSRHQPTRLRTPNGPSPCGGRAVRLWSRRDAHRRGMP